MKWYNISIMFKGQVKCSECGFLGRHIGSGSSLEISPRNRSELLSLHVVVRFTMNCLRKQDYFVAGITSPGESITQEALHKGSSLSRYCEYYHRYNPGYTPDQHLELQREKNQRSFLIKVSLLSAVVGAAIATLVNLIWS